MDLHTIMQSDQLNQTGHTNSEKSEELEITSFINPDDPLNEFINKEEFSKAVVYHVQFYKTTYMEAIMEIAQKIGLEPQHDTDQIKVLLDDNVRHQMYLESVRSHSVSGELTNQIDV